MQQGEYIVGILTEHKIIGPVILPYVCCRSHLEFTTVVERLTSLNTGSYPWLDKAGMELCALAESFSNQQLLNQFSKKNLAVKEFIDKLDKKLLEEQIRPFIERRLAKIVALLNENNIELYDGKAIPNLFPQDKITIEPNLAEIQLKFSREEDGTRYQLRVFHQKLPVNLKTPGNIILTKEPCYYLSGKSILSFDEGFSGKLLIPFSRKDTVEIPKHLEYQYFNTFIKKLLKKTNIEAEGFVLHDLDLQPIPVLSMELSWQGKSVLVLSFLYGERNILANEPQKTFTKLIADENGFIFHRFSRKKSAEQKFITFLRNLGLYQSEATFLLASPSLSQTPLYELVSWLTSNREKLIQQGFTIAQQAGIKFSLELPQLSITARKNNDWFDVYASVTLGELEIPFLSFKEHILNNIREFILPAGQIFIIPDEWFAKYQHVLFHSLKKGHDIRVRKHHFNLLLDLEIDGIQAVASPPVPHPIQLPGLQNIRLRPYQIVAFYWLHSLAENGAGGILADDMGLGKTIEVIALLTAYHPKRQPLPLIHTGGDNNKASRAEIQLDLFSEYGVSNELSYEKNEIPTPAFPVYCSLIIVPSSLVHNWLNELRKISPHLTVYIYTGNQRRLNKSIINQYDILLTTYGTLRNDIDLLSGFVFGYVILDESQNIKNPSSKTAQSAFNLTSQHRLAITGTPIENALSDIWSQMNFVNPGILGSLKSFNNYYVSRLINNPDDAVAEKLYSLIKPFILRRTKEEVSPELPPLTESIRYCRMTEEQQLLYETKKNKIRNFLISKFNSDGVSRSGVHVLRALMQLRQLANHPLMVDIKSETGSGKFDEITSQLEVLMAENHKVLVFSSFIKHLSLLEEYCSSHGHRFVTLKGSTTNREKVINKFRYDRTKIFLISLKAGGVGLNLTEADYVFILDPWWNPASEMQAINRAHRIGQDKNVFVYRFISVDTIEEKILKLQQRKNALANLFIKPSSTLAGMSEEEVLDMFA